MTRPRNVTQKLYMVSTGNPLDMRPPVGFESAKKAQNHASKFLRSFSHHCSVYDHAALEKLATYTVEIDSLTVGWWVGRTADAPGTWTLDLTWSKAQVRLWKIGA